MSGVAVEKRVCFSVLRVYMTAPSVHGARPRLHSTGLQRPLRFAQLFYARWRTGGRTMSLRIAFWRKCVRSSLESSHENSSKYEKTWRAEGGGQSARVTEVEKGGGRGTL